MLCLIFGKNHNFKTGQRWVCGGFVWFSWYVFLVGVVLVLFVVFGFGFVFFFKKTTCIMGIVKQVCKVHLGFGLTTYLSFVG